MTKPPFAFFDARWGKPHLVWPIVEHYASGDLALRLVGVGAYGQLEPWATITVALENETPIDEHIFVKDWSENAGIVELLVAANIITNKPRRHLISGFVTVSEYPLTDTFLNYVKEQAE
jgi:hypothetical protein